MTIRVITTTISRDWTCDLGSAATCMDLVIYTVGSRVKCNI